MQPTIQMSAPITEDRLLGNRYQPVGALAYRRGKARASDLPPQLQCSSTDDQANVTAFKIWHTKPRQNQIIRSIIKTSVHLKKSYLGRLVPYAIKTKK